MRSRVAINGATALVTGAGSGIGRATATRLAGRGARILAVDLDEVTAKTTAALCVDAGVESVAYTCDVRDRGAVADLASQVEREHGAVDILVNSAGVGMSGRFLDMSLDDWEWIRSVNLDGIVHCCHAFGPGMLERGRGHVANLSSGLAYMPSAMTPAYSTTKAAVLMFSRAIRADWATAGVGVSAICPGVINTPIINATRFVGALDGDRARRMASRGFARGHSPDIVARAIVGAIEHNRGIVPVGVESVVGWHLAKVVPASVVGALGRPLPGFVERILAR